MHTEQSPIMTGLPGSTLIHLALVADVPLVPGVVTALGRAWESGKMIHVCTNVHPCTHPCLSHKPLKENKHLIPL